MRRHPHYNMRHLLERSSSLSGVPYIPMHISPIHQLRYYSSEENFVTLVTPCRCDSDCLGSIISRTTY